MHYRISVLRLYPNDCNAMQWKCHAQDLSPELASYHLTSVYLAGVAGGTVQLAIASPVELVKIRLQTQTGHSR